MLHKMAVAGQSRSVRIDHYKKAVNFQGFRFTWTGEETPADSSKADGIFLVAFHFRIGAPRSPNAHFACLPRRMVTSFTLPNAAVPHELFPKVARSPVGTNVPTGACSKTDETGFSSNGRGSGPSSARLAYELCRATGWHGPEWS